MTQFENGESLISVREKINEAIQEVDRTRNNASGWAKYIDTTYISGNEFIIDANTPTVIPNNGANAITAQTPTDYAAVGMYDPQMGLIKGFFGDSLLMTLEFIVDRQSGAGSYNFETWIQYSGITDHHRTLIISGDASHDVSMSFSAYIPQEWHDNGAQLFARSSVDSFIYDIKFKFDRLHKAF